MQYENNYTGTLLKACVLIAMCLLVASCGFFRAPGKHKCDKILPREQMTDILTDIYVLEAFLREYQHIEPDFNDSIQYYYRALFDKHEVDREVFEEALNCYLLDRKEIDIIHETMLNHLSLIESEVESKGRDVKETASE